MDDFTFGQGPGFGTHGETDFAEMNKGVTPVFMNEPVQNFKKTEAEGRPIFDTMEIVQIFVAGDEFNRVSHPVDDAIRRRFASQYAAWKSKGDSKTVSGTPLKMWPLLTIANVAEFEALNIFDVEGLSNIPDTSLPRMPGLRDWRERAKAWLANAKGGAEASRLAAENAQLKDDVAGLKSEIERISRMVEKGEKHAKAA